MNDEIRDSLRRLLPEAPNIEELVAKICDICMEHTHCFKNDEALTMKTLGKACCKMIDKLIKDPKFNARHLLPILKKHAQNVAREKESAQSTANETTSSGKSSGERGGNGKSKAKLPFPSGAGSPKKERTRGKVVGVSNDFIYIEPLDAATKQRVSIRKSLLNAPGISLHVGNELTYIPSAMKDTWGHAPELVKVRLNEEEMQTYLDALVDIGEERELDMLSQIQSCRSPWDFICDREQLRPPVVSSLLRVVKLLALVTKKISLRGSERLAGFFDEFAQTNVALVVLPHFVKRNIVTYDSEEAIAVRAYIEAVAKVAPVQFLRLISLMKRLLFIAHLNDYSGQTSNSMLESNSWNSVKETLGVMKSLILSMGGIEDNIEGLEWHELPLVPSRRELTFSKANNFPVVRVKEAYESEDEYLDTYFRLLRGDCFFELSTGVRNFLDGTLDKRDMALYRVSIDGIQITSSGMALSLRFEVLGKGSVNWKFSNLLMFGNLLCLSLRGDFQAEQVWATVAHRSEDLLKKGIIFVTLLSASNRLTDYEVILELQSADPVSTPYNKATKVIIMAESPTYYRAYGPVLRCLQTKSDGLPFVDELVKLKSKSRPSYFRRGLCDWSVIFDKQSLPAPVSGPTSQRRHHVSYDMMGYEDDFEESEDDEPSEEDRRSLWRVDLLDSLIAAGVKTTLDHSQLAGIKTAISNRISLIQGPPGTGKSYIGVKLVELILSMPSKPEGPILVLTYKNHSLDQFLVDCLQFCDDIVRIGGRSQNEKLDEKNLAHLRNKSMGRNNRLGDLRQQMRSLKTELNKTSKSLRNCRIFDVEAFFKFASWSQICCLLEFCPKQGKSHKIAADLRKILNSLSESDGRDFLEKNLSKYSDVLRAWVPSSSELNAAANVPSTSSCVALLKGYSDEKQKEEKEAEDDTNQDDVEEIEEQRLLSHDFEKAGQWRNQGDGFAFIDTRRPSGFQFSTSVPLPSRDYNFSNPLGYDKVDNLWELSVPDRAQLVLSWQSKIQDEVNASFTELVKKQDQLLEEIRDLESSADANVIKNADIVGMTTTGAAIHALLINKVAPSIILVEEAAEILESQLLAVLPENAEHLIMIGDHQQLRPQVQSYDLIRHNNFDISMFERLIRGGLPYAQLEYQCRMREEFVELIRSLYPKLKTHHQLVAGNQRPLCIAKSMYFLDHFSKEDSSSHSRSRRNLDEVNLVISVLEWLLREGQNPERVTILTTYRGQLSEIKKKIKAMKVEGVKTSTVDRYQGDENDIILVSLVRQDKLGFLRASNRMCVAASRARCGNYFFGNAELLATDPFLTDLLFAMKEKGCVGTDFPIVCPRHPGRPIKLGSQCAAICPALLDCGHTCRASCHPTGVHPLCKQSVDFKFPLCGHSTKKICSAPEEKLHCSVLVFDRHEKCGHAFQRKCSRSRDEFSCTERCIKLLSCGHPCPLTCSKPCASVDECPVCFEIQKIEREKEAEMLRKLEMQHRKSAEEELARLKDTPVEATLKPVEWSSENGDLFAEIQDQLNSIHESQSSEVRVEKILHAVNLKAHQSWLKAKTRMVSPSDPVHRYVMCSEDEIDAAFRAGLNAFPATRLLKPGEKSQLSSSGNVMLRFKVLKGKTDRFDSLQNARSTFRGKAKFDSGTISNPQGKENLILRENDLALLDYVAYIGVVLVQRDKARPITELGMTLAEGHYEIRNLECSRSLGQNRLDQLLYREAESQFLRMLGKNAGKYKVSQVEYIDNGKLNLMFKETKEAFAKSGKSTDEVFAFHGTNEEAIQGIAAEGFKIGGVDTLKRHGAVYGIGVYTAEDPSVAMHYARIRKVLLARVIPGQLNADFNYGATKEILVLKSKGQIVPQYIVHYTEHDYAGTFV